MTDVYFCNRCNLESSTVRYCPDCGCPEHRLMKPQSWFLVKVSPYRHDALVKLVQAMCAEPFMKDIIAVGPWEFKIDTTDNSSWWHLWVTAEYDVWREIDPEPMQKWLKDRLVEYEAGREEVPTQADPVRKGS